LNALQDRHGEIEHLSVQIEHKQKQEKEGSRIDWRRSKVQELSSQGHPQREMAHILQVSSGTVNRDLSYLIQQAKHNIRRYIDERLPEEYEKCLVGTSSSDKSNEDDKESNEPDYDDDYDEKPDKEGEEKQEQRTGEITATTVNTIF
jgi:Trp operon repressor